MSLFPLPSGLIADYQNFVDSFNSTDNFAWECRAIYPQMQVACVNCIVDPITHRSANVYNGTGPVPFSNGSLCPWCNGIGYNQSESYDTVYVRIEKANRRIQDWYALGPNVEKSQQIVEIRGFIKDLPKFERCEYLEVSTDIAPYGKMRFRPKGKMLPYGLQTRRYVLGYWEQVN